MQKLLAAWNLRWASWRFSSWFWIALLPKMWKILSVQHMTHPQHRFTKYYTCQNIQQNNWVWWCSASIMLNLKTNILEIYLTNPYHFILEILLRTSWFFWYIKIFIRSFSFWDIKNVKAKFQPRYAYKLYAYKKRLYKIWKKAIDYCEN